MFTFKQFAVSQDKTAMKVGTDGVLLGAWTSPPITITNILDIGTGTGLIALMLAQRFENATIDGVEIDLQSSIQAEDNFKASSWGDRITTYNLSIQEFLEVVGDKRYGCIVSNPPYFSNSLKCPDSKRTVARHNNSLSIEALLYCSSKLISSEGVLSVILPIQEGGDLISLSSQFGFKAEHICRVFPTSLSSEPKRLLIDLRFTANDTVCHESNLVIEKDTRFDYTQEYISLTKDFYLKF